MTKEQAIAKWKNICLPYIREHYEQDGKIASPEREAGWNHLMDELQKRGRVTPQQRASWGVPREIYRCR